MPEPRPVAPAAPSDADASMAADASTTDSPNQLALPIDSPGDGAFAPEPSFLVRAFLGAAPAYGARWRGPDHSPPFGRIDDAAATLGLEPGATFPGEGTLTSSDLAHDPLPDLPGGP